MKATYLEQLGGIGPTGGLTPSQHGRNFRDVLPRHRKIPMKALTDDARGQAFFESRLAQGLPETIIEPAVLAAVVALLVQPKQISPRARESRPR